MAQNPDIATAVKKIKDAEDAYDKAARYYRGEHDLCFATEKFRNVFGQLFREFALNMCPAVVDAVRDKLVVENFSVEEGDAGIAEEAWAIWQANRMGVAAGQVHKEAVKNGDAYAIVWPNPSTGKVTIYPNRAANCCVEYDDETPGKILWAAKYWKTNDKRLRMNLYYPDRIERYATKQDKWLDEAAKSTTPTPTLNATAFEPLADGPVITNPYGVVPVFHFANNADLDGAGQSELAAALPIQDALNKSVLDMMVAMEFSAYRQRWAAGIEIEYDETTGAPIPPFKAGIERLWITENGEAKFGDFEATDLEQFLSVKDGFRTDMATVTGTPLHYFMLTGAAFPQSGVSIEKLESRFLNKVRDRQQAFGQTWEDLMAFALLIEGKKDVRLFVDWQDPAPMSELDKLNNLILKKEIGVTDSELMIEAGYGEDDIKRMLEEKAAAREAMVRSFNAGEDLEENAK